MPSRRVPVFESPLQSAAWSAVERLRGPTKTRVEYLTKDVRAKYSNYSARPRALLSAPPPPLSAKFPPLPAAAAVAKTTAESEPTWEVPLDMSQAEVQRREMWIKEGKD